MGRGRVRSDRRGASGQGSRTFLSAREGTKGKTGNGTDAARTRTGGARTYHARVQIVLRLDADDRVEGGAGRDDRLGLRLGRGGERALAHGSRRRK